MQEKQESVDEFESFNLDENVPSSSNAESEVVEKIEAPSEKLIKENGMLYKIEALIGEITTLSEINKRK